jgi:hypothetical protein
LLAYVAVHLGLGDTTRALDRVEQLPGDRGSARFQRVLERLGLGETAKRTS